MRIFQNFKKKQNFTLTEEETNMEPKLSPPWVNYYNQINALFGEDPDIHVSYVDEPPTITLRIDTQKKYDAISKLLPLEKEFGNVTVKVILIPADDNAEPTYTQVFQDAFEGNPAFSEIITATVFQTPITYVMFKKKVVQYFNDDTGDPHGNKSTLYQDIAREVFDVPANVNFCTDTSDACSAAPF